MHTLKNFYLQVKTINELFEFKCTMLCFIEWIRYCAIENKYMNLIKYCVVHVNSEGTVDILSMKNYKDYI